jgi:hypothetical protein
LGGHRGHTTATSNRTTLRSDYLSISQRNGHNKLNMKANYRKWVFEKCRYGQSQTDGRWILHVRAGGVVNFCLTPRDISKQKDVAKKESTIGPICSHRRAPTLMKSLSPGVTPDIVLHINNFIASKSLYYAIPALSLSFFITQITLVASFRYFSNAFTTEVLKSSNVGKNLQ